MSHTCVLLALIISCSSKIAAAACYDNAQVFKQSEWPNCHEVSTSLYVYSGKSGDFMKLGMDLKGHTGAWSALATAGNGGMKGARMIVVRKDTSSAWIAEDRYSQDYVTPSLYSKQDVHLMFAKEANGGTSWAVLLPINACKSMENGFETNYPLSDDVNRWMLWAIGSSHSFGYHKSRGQFQTNLLSGPKITPSTAGHDTVDIVMPDVPVVTAAGGSDAKNPYICVIVDLQKLTSRNLTLKQHVSKFSPILDADSKQYVHHMVLFGCNTNQGFQNANHGAVLPECESMPKGCYEFKYPWALGSQPFTMPSDVGFPFGEGHTWLALQMHYYNPQGVPNIRDSSGVRLSFAPAVRPYDAGLFTINGGTSPDMRPAMPAQTANNVLDFITPGSCTQTWAEPINVIGALYHAHLVGKYLNIDVLRNGTYLSPLFRENGYDFSHQSLSDVNVKTLLAGDELHMRCVYDTSARTDATGFGDLTQTEMCWSAFMYYPAQRVSDSQYATYSEHDSLKPQDGNHALATCINPGTEAGYTDVSLMTQNMVRQPLVEFFDDSQGHGMTAAYICNDGVPDGKGGVYTPEMLTNHISGLCPDCMITKSCTTDIMKLHYQQTLSPKKCNGFGLSNYPDVSRTSVMMPDQITHCGHEQKTFKATTYTVPLCSKSGDLSSSAAEAISSAVAAAAGVTSTPTPNGSLSKVYQAKLTVGFEDPNAFVQSPHAATVMKEAIAGSSTDLTTSMIEILNISVASRRLSGETRRLAGTVDCNYEVTQPASYTGPAFTAASVNTETLKTTIKTKAASRGLTVTVTSAVQHEPQEVTVGTSTVGTSTGDSVSACGSTAMFAVLVAVFAGQQSK